MGLIGGLLKLVTGTHTKPKRRLAGKVSVDGTGAMKRVMILKRGSGEYVSSTVSKPDGTWSINDMPVLPEQSLVAIAFDDSGQYNAEILDCLSQVEQLDQ